MEILNVYCACSDPLRCIPVQLCVTSTGYSYLFFPFAIAYSCIVLPCGVEDIFLTIQKNSFFYSLSGILDALSLRLGVCLLVRLLSAHWDEMFTLWEAAEPVAVMDKSHWLEESPEKLIKITESWVPTWSHYVRILGTQTGHSLVDSGPGRTT